MSVETAPPHDPRAVRVIIVDDEGIARRRLRRMLHDIPGVVVVAEAASAREARPLVDALAPEILFVDVEMPGEGGLALIESLSGRALPLVVMVTAHAQYALPAFERAAVAYVVKPVRAERLRAATERARLLATALGSRERGDAATARLDIRIGTRRIPVDVADILWLEADENYVRIHTESKRLLVRASLSAFLLDAGATEFVRVHRSHAVNWRRVREVRQREGGRALMVMDDGSEVPASRRYADQVDRVIRGDVA